MDWRDILISQAISTIIIVVREAPARSKFRKALHKVFREIALHMGADEAVREVAKELLK